MCERCLSLRHRFGAELGWLRQSNGCGPQRSYTTVSTMRDDRAVRAIIARLYGFSPDFGTWMSCVREIDRKDLIEGLGKGCA